MTETLAQSPQPRRRHLLVAFWSAEEIGLVGGVEVERPEPGAGPDHPDARRQGRDLHAVFVDQTPTPETPDLSDLGRWTGSAPICAENGGMRSFLTLGFGRPSRLRRGLAVFEVSERTMKAMLLVLLGGPLAVLLLTPLVRPFRWGRLLWTYVLPVVPLALTWDGVVSCLRSYTVAELSAMTGDLANDGYRWEVGRARLEGLPATATYLMGIPAHPSSKASETMDEHG